MFNFKVTGLDDIQKKLSKMKNEINKQAGGRVQLDDLMPPDLIKKCTGNKFDDISKMADACPLNAQTMDEMQSMLEGPEWDKFVKENTTYSSWQEMKNIAAGQYEQKKIDKIIKDI